MERLDEYPPKEAWQVAWALTQQPGAEGSSKRHKELVSSEIQPAEQPIATTQPLAVQQPKLHSSERAATHETLHSTKTLGHTAMQQAATAQPASAATAATASPAAMGLRNASLPAWPLHVLRSSQMDAQRLDAELLTLLREQLQHALALFQPGHVADWEPELHALLRLMVFGLSVLRGGATPGSQLLNLRYRSELPLSWHRTASHAHSTHSSSPHVTPSHCHSQQSSNASSAAQPAALRSVGKTAGSRVPVGIPLGGRTGVEGPGLSLKQRVFLGIGLVVIPYAWSRLSTYLARVSSPNDVTTWADLHAQTVQNSMSSTVPDATMAHGQDLASQGQETKAVSNQQQQEERRGPKGILGVIYSLLLQRPHRLLMYIARSLKQLAGSLQHVLSPDVKGMQGAAEREVLHNRVWRGMRVVEAVYRAATMANFLVFLSGGRYRSVLERLVGARLVYMQPVMTRIISFEYLNRQLVWQEVSELLLFLLPMLDAARARRSLNRLLPRLPDPRRLLRNVLGDSSDSAGPAGGVASAGFSGGDSSTAATGKMSEQQGSSGGGSAATAAAVTKRPEGPCPVCGSCDILTPVVAVPCGHCFCYYCLASNSAHDSHYQCPCDGVRVAAMERWRPGIKVTSV